MKFSIARRAAVLIVLASFVFSNAIAVSAAAGDTQQSAASASALAKYTTDLTQLGREGRLRENLSFESETTRLIKVLAEGGVRQPVIVDEDKESSQDTIVEQLAIRIARGTVPGNLLGKKVVKLETAVLFSNTRSQKEAAAAVNAVIDEVIAAKGQIILFTGELTNVVGAGQKQAL